MDLCLACNCTNSDLRLVPAPAKLNAKREKRGRSPLYGYHMIELQEPQGHGTHASPAQHLRRGHIRRLGGNRITWVRPAVVGLATQRGTMS